MFILIIYAYLLVLCSSNFTIELNPILSAPINPFHKYRQLFQDQSQIPVINVQNIQYYSLIQIGSPPQWQTVTFDTGSHLLWIPISQKTNFSFTDSKTAKITNTKGSIQYGKGYVSGYMGSDILTIPNLGIKVNQSLLWVNYEDDDIADSVANGLLGLSNLKSIKNFLDLAYEAKQINSSVFMFELRDLGSRSVFYAGFIPEKFKNLTYLPATENDFWMIEVLGLEIEGDFIRSNSKKAVVDSGTSLLYLSNEAAVTLLESLMNKGLCYYNGICVCPNELNIDLYPKIKIWGYGAIFILNGYDYIFRYPTQTSGCQFGVSVINTDFMLFGDVFMRKFPVVYDKINNRMGFSGTLPMGIIDPWIVVIVEWIWLVVLIIIIGIFIGLRIQIQKIRNNSKKTITQLFLE